MRTVEFHTFLTHDDVALSYRYWPAQAPEPAQLPNAHSPRAIALFHRGHEVGFDSGSMLDYVYRNTPTGTGPVGRFMVRHYLPSIGWRGIRQRKLHLEELLKLAIARLQQTQTPVHILDLGKP